MPEMVTAPARVRANSRKSEPQRDRRVHRREGDGHRDDGADQLARAGARRRQRRHARAHVPLDVLHDHDGVVDHEADGEHDGQQGEQVDGESEELHQRHGADQRDRYGDHRDQDRAQRAKEEEDDQHDDEQGLGQGVLHLAHGVLDVIGAVVGDDRGDLLGDLPLQAVHLGAHAADHIQRVRVGQGPNPVEDRGLTGEVDRRVVVLRAQHDIGHVAQANHRAIAFAYHQLLELVHRGQAGVGGEIDLDHGAFGLAHGRQGIVGGQRLADLAGAKAEGRHAIGL